MPEVMERETYGVIYPKKEIEGHSKHIVIINGGRKSGKKLFIDFVSDFLLNNTISIYDFTKYVADYAGYVDSMPDDKDIKFLKSLRALIDDYNDSNYFHLTKEVNSFFKAPEPFLLFVYIDDIDTILRFKKDFPYSKAIFIKRSIEEGPYTKTLLPDERFTYDRVIDNNDTIESLYSKAEEFSRDLMRGTL